MASKQPARSNPRRVRSGTEPKSPAPNAKLELEFSRTLAWLETPPNERPKHPWDMTEDEVMERDLTDHEYEMWEDNRLFVQLWAIRERLGPSMDEDDLETLKLAIGRFGSLVREQSEHYDLLRSTSRARIAYDNGKGQLGEVAKALGWILEAGKVQPRYDDLEIGRWFDDLTVPRGPGASTFLFYDNTPELETAGIDFSAADDSTSDLRRKLQAAGPPGWGRIADGPYSAIVVYGVPLDPETAIEALAELFSSPSTEPLTPAACRKRLAVLRAWCSGVRKELARYASNPVAEDFLSNLPDLSRLREARIY